MRYRSRQPGGAWKDRFPDTRKRLSATRQRLSNKFTEKGVNSVAGGTVLKNLSS